MSKPENQLLDCFYQLPEEARQSLLDFAEFLVQRHAVRSPVADEPLGLPRPDNETVIAAIKRLSRNYPMLNKDKLLHETAGLVTEHMMRGRDALEVIDELELIFERHYQALNKEE
ncbi:Crp/Fnr family transcriptional regulator [Thiohalophilus sp.]|uniref:Crp/Fnr family transcriptional regulator n=1 Tax=Thiohalophilus sp. TaxID=3028392 RepID=UPI00397670FB